MHAGACGIVCQGKIFPHTTNTRPIEDAFLVFCAGDYTVAIVADGHGGFECAKFCVHHFMEALQPMLLKVKDTVPDDDLSTVPCLPLRYMQIPLLHL